MIRFIKRGILAFINVAGLRKIIFKTPGSYVSIVNWVKENNRLAGVHYYFLKEKQYLTESPPVIIGRPVSRRFTKYYERSTGDAFVASIPAGRVLGQDCNLIISPDHKVFGDVSREFGAEGGKKPKDFSLFNAGKKMPVYERLKGNIAVISTAGSGNFHHWNFDIIPRFFLLKEAGIFDRIDYFLLNYKGLPFQKEGLEKLGVDPLKIINSNGHKDFYVEAEQLWVPSLPEELGTITPWVVDFLRDTFLDNISTEPVKQIKKLYLSRKNVSSRKIINEAEVMEELRKRGYTEFIPEDYSIVTAAKYFAAADSIVSVHGSGLSNLPFIKPGVKVLDILAPYHQDGYYWMMCNRRKAKYVGLFAEGDHPPDDKDLVKIKVDSDLLIDMGKFRQALDEVE